MKVKILVPESLSEITLEQYQKFLKISKDNEDSLFLQQKMVEIFCSIDLKSVMNIKYNSIKKITTHLNNLFEQKPKFIETFIKDKKKFSFIPSLDDMSFGEFVDLDTTLTDWETMDKAMGVLFRPETQRHKHKYLIEPYDNYDSYDMQKMPLDVVLGSLVFFWNLSKELINHIPSYFLHQMESLTSQQEQTLEESGVGILAFMDLVRETSQKLTMLPDCHYINA